MGTPGGAGQTQFLAQTICNLGYEVKVRGPWEFAFGGVEVIRLHENGQVLMGAADPRRDGYAVGY